MVASALQKLLIRGIRRVQLDHVRDRKASFVTREPFDGIPGAYVAFLLNGEIEPAAATPEETLDHLGLSEADRKLVAGHAWLCDDEFCSTDTIAVPNPNLILQ